MVSGFQPSLNSIRSLSILCVLRISSILSSRLLCSTYFFSESTILTTVLKTDIFFNVAQHPEARFASTKIEPAENGYLVTGNFTMKGVTQGVQFPAVIERRPEGVFVKAEFTIDRKLWDVGYDQYEDSVVLKEVVISFEILAEPVQ